MKNTQITVIRTIIITVFVCFAVSFCFASCTKKKTVEQEQVEQGQVEQWPFKERGNQTRCLNNLKSLGIALMIYSDENDGKLPFVEPNSGNSPDAGVKNLSLLRRGTLEEPDNYRCPSATAAGHGMDSKTQDYENNIKYGEVSTGYFDKEDVSYAYLTGSARTHGVLRSGQTIQPASGIMSDGFTGIGGVEKPLTDNSDSSGHWNHQNYGAWVRVDTGAKTSTAKNWPDEVGNYGNGTANNWAVFCTNTDNE